MQPVIFFNTQCPVLPCLAPKTGLTVTSPTNGSKMALLAHCAQAEVPIPSDLAALGVASSVR